MEYFPSVENKKIVNYLFNKYGNVFQYKVNILRIYLFEDKLKRNIEMNNWNRIFIDILDYKFTKEFIKESGICLKNKYWFIFEVWKLYI